MEKKIPHIFRKDQLTDVEGNKIPHGEKFTLCGCTKSKKLPFCDGSHKLD